MDNLLNRILQKFSIAGGELEIGGVSSSLLATDFGTPLFVYDREILESKWKLLRTTFPPEFGICYSVKANPTRAFLQFFLAKGCGLEIASSGEFFQAIDAGCSPLDILFAGPGKSVSDLELVLGKNIGEIHAESFVEIERIGDISKKLGVTANVAIRVNPNQQAQGGAMRMGGKPTQFGIDEELLDSALEKIGNTPHVEFRGIHLFSGTQILDHMVLLSQYRKGVELARSIANHLQRPLQTVDFGGGLGIPYFAKDNALDMGALQNGLSDLMAQVRSDKNFEGTRFLIEPGRYLVGDAGVYIARVIDIKVSRNKKFVVIDGGMNHHLAASGNLGQVIKRNFPVAVLTQFNQPAEEVVNIVGPLCTPLDTIARDIRIPVPQIGDLIGVFQSGAYGRTSSPMSFLSHCSPPEVLIENGTPRLIRRRGTIDDLFIDMQ
jgi:diaminopimelate decarboxylase